ncbi:MAG: hypothetical protein AB1441_07295 [Bacillota bacterium]
MDWTLGPLDVVLLGLGLVLISMGNAVMFADRLARSFGAKLKGVADPRGLSMFIGLWVFGLGVLTALFPVGVRVVGVYYGWALAALAVIGILRVYTGYPRYLKKGENSRP